MEVGFRPVRAIEITNFSTRGRLFEAWLELNIGYEALNLYVSVVVNAG